MHIINVTLYAYQHHIVCTPYHIVCITISHCMHNHITLYAYHHHIVCISTSHCMHNNITLYAYQYHIVCISISHHLHINITLYAYQHHIVCISISHCMQLNITLCALSYQLLYQLLQQQNKEANDYIESISDQMLKAVKQCIEAAGHEYEPAKQKDLLRVNIQHTSTTILCYVHK